MIFINQHDQMDCGPACLSMIAKHYGKNIDINYFRKEAYLSREGVNLLGISEAATSIGFNTFPATLSNEELVSNKENLPCILHWNQNHFVVLYKIKKNRFNNNLTFKIADPAHGLVKLSKEKFNNSWLSNDNQGIVLFLEPTEKLFEFEDQTKNYNYLKHILKYTKPFKKQLAIMFLMLFLGSCVTFMFPFLTQNLIDKGVNAKNINIISIILLAQLTLFIGSITFEIIRNWLMLFVGTKLSIAIVSDFLRKLFKLPLSFFETKSIGDFNQRIQDNSRVERFLTSQSLTTVFSIITFSVFFIVLWYYDIKILLVYILLTVIAICWSLFWLQRRKILDYFRFQQASEHQESIYEIVNGVTEMKLYQLENFKLNKWENIQRRLFETNIRLLKIEQFQLSGFEFINQFKNIVVTFIAAMLVVKGEITLGAMLSISYIIGQMNTPVNQLITFFRSLQDAKLSMERINEVQVQPEEEDEQDQHLKLLETTQIPPLNGINLKNVSFQYEGPKSSYILKDLNLFIPEGKITAIVGSSGSGKTTLMKLLLKFYSPVEGSIYYNNDDLKTISAKSLREHCGVVMQDGYIFSESIERNIATSDENYDVQKLQQAVNIANIEGFIEDSVLGYKKKLGAAGNSISGGQKQRILIARAVYKNPHYLFFDEATSALDAENEKIIHDNLQSFFKGKTVVIIAHRLSTVKNADQIIVLKNGEIVEKGTHQELVTSKKEYYNLVKNQLELGS